MRENKFRFVGETMDKILLGSLCCEKIDFVSTEQHGKIDYIDISSIDNEEKKIIGYTTYNLANAPSRAKQILQCGDVLVSTVRPNLNAVALCDLESENLLVGSTGFCVLRTKENLSRKYIYYVCQSKCFIKELINVATGASYPAVSKKDILNVRIPKHTIEEQLKIVKTIDTVKNLIKLYRNQLNNFDALIKSRFVEMFGDPVKNDFNWETKRLEDVCDGIGDGLHGTPEYAEDGEYPFINGNNLMEGFIEITSATKMVDEDTYRRYYIDLSDNAILISINGTLGKLAFYNGEKVMLGKSACYCNLKSNIKREFVYAVMNSNAFISFMESNSTKSTIKNVGLKTMRDFELILPPIELQKQFADFFQQVDKSKVTIQKSLDKLQLLYDSLMQKYFG